MTIDEPRPLLVITAGEPAGIGPDILIEAVQNQLDVGIVVIADPELLEARARLLKLPLTLQIFDPALATINKPSLLNIIPVKLSKPCNPGILDVNNAQYVLETIEAACDGCLQGTFSALVTAPVNKAIINKAGFAFSGHTEFLAQCCGTAAPVMLLANQELRVALVTTHLPLNKVSQSITQERLESVIKIVWHDLRNRFGIYHPRILVCGLNPHAGEDGHLGDEEKDIIIPVLENLRDVIVNLDGPVPADTAFTPERLKQADVVICMYHDQGLPVIKANGFGNTVNITLGLPVIRTSVDHGTALDLAGTGKANCSSMMAAIKSAKDLCITSQTGNITDPGISSTAQQYH